MMRFMGPAVAGALLGCVACANVLAIKMPSKDPNPQAYYTCEPEGAALECHSAQTLHQYDVRLEPSEQKCEYGIYEVHVKTNWHGGISKVQYQCAVASSLGGFPAVVPGAAPAGAGGQAGGH